MDSTFKTRTSLTGANEGLAKKVYSQLFTKQGTLPGPKVKAVSGTTELKYVKEESLRNSPLKTKISVYDVSNDI